MKLPTENEMKRKIIEGRFLSFLKTGKRYECWPFMGGRNKDGYGNFHTDYPEHKTVRAHRFAYILFVAPIPKGLFVLHSCDNPPCCNPKHLFLGTQKDNMNDAARKNRIAPAPKGNLNPAKRLDVRRKISEAIRGENHYAAKLTNDHVAQIRMFYDGSFEAREKLAKKFGVKPKHILAIFMGQKRKDPNYQPDLTRLTKRIPRIARGEKFHSAKLTNDQVKSIRNEYDGTSGCLARLGRKYGVKSNHIGRIIRMERRRFG